MAWTAALAAGFMPFLYCFGVSIMAGIAFPGCIHGFNKLKSVAAG